MLCLSFRGLRHGDAERAEQQLEDPPYRGHNEEADDAPYHVSFAGIAFLGIIRVDKEFNAPPQEHQKGRGKKQADERIEYHIV